MRRIVPALLLLGSARIALADDVTTRKVDVDGDGKVDVVTVDATGVTVKIGKKEHAQRWAETGSFEGATLTSGGKGKQPYLAVSARFRVDGREIGEGLVLRWQAGALAEVWRGPVGPIGRDADYAVALEATAAGVVRSQRRAGFDRCDGAPAELFREGWNDAAGKFQPIRGSVTIAASATTLTATREAPDGAPTLSAIYRAAVASTEAGATDASQLGAPHQLDDGDAATAWTEDRGGDGRGEWFTYRARHKGAKLAGLRILAGDARGTTEMAASNRVARLAVVTPDRAYWIDLPDDTRADAWWVKLPEPVAAECVTVLLADFHPGKGAKAGKGTSVVSELVVLAEEDVAPGGAAAKLIADVIAGGIDGDSASKLLSRRGAAAARAIEAELTAGRIAGDAEVRLWKILAAIGDPGSAAALGAGLRAEGVTADDAWVLAEALGKLGDAGQAELAQTLADVALRDEPRLAAAAAIDDAHRDAMIAALGAGSWPVRKALVLRVAHDVAALIAAASQAATDGAPAREADLWRAVGLAALRGEAADQELALTALAARGRDVTTYELRYRIVSALSALPLAGVADAVRAILEPLTGDEGNAIRQIAAVGLGGSTADGAAELLADLATNGDPGVRIAALHALAGRGDLGASGGWTAGDSTDAVDRVIITALSGDAWPEVRHTAASALAIACPRKGPTAALEAAAEDDDDVGVRADALAALVTCDAPGIADRLLAVAKDGGAPIPLRDRAVDLLGELGDPAVAPALIDLLARWRSAAFSEDAGLVLAQRAAIVVGRLGAVATDAKVIARIVDALLDTAEDGAFPEIQSAGVAGLGELGPRCTQDARALLRELKSSDQPAVKLSAERALATCAP